MNTQWELYFLRREIERQKIQKQRKKKRRTNATITMTTSSQKPIFILTRFLSCAAGRFPGPTHLHCSACREPFFSLFFVRFRGSSALFAPVLPYLYRKVVNSF